MLCSLPRTLLRYSPWQKIFGGYCLSPPHTHYPWMYSLCVTCPLSRFFLSFSCSILIYHGFTGPPPGHTRLAPNLAPYPQHSRGSHHPMPSPLYVNTFSFSWYQWRLLQIQSGMKSGFSWRGTVWLSLLTSPHQHYLWGARSSWGPQRPTRLVTSKSPHLLGCVSENCPTYPHPT